MRERSSLLFFTWDPKVLDPNCGMQATSQTWPFDATDDEDARKKVAAFIAEDKRRKPERLFREVSLTVVIPKGSLIVKMFNETTFKFGEEDAQGERTVEQTNYDGEQVVLPSPRCKIVVLEEGQHVEFIPVGVEWDPRDTYYCGRAKSIVAG